MRGGVGARLGAGQGWSVLDQYSHLLNSGIGSNNSIGWQMFEILIRV